MMDNNSGNKHKWIYQIAGQSLASLCKRVVILLLCSVVALPISAAEPDLLQRLSDRAEIEDVANKYIIALDTRDADLYVSVFTEDAEYDIEGQIVRGHDELRAIISGLQSSRDEAVAEGRPVVDLYHSNLNPYIEIKSSREATYRAYWQTLRRTDGNFMRVGGMGIIEDEMVKTNGIWRIRKRVLSNFIVRE